jgi:hypothetical protein
MLRHQNITHQHESVSFTHFSQHFHKKMARPNGSQERSSFVTAEGNEMQIAFPVVSSQISRHRRKEQPTLSFRKDGAPSSYHPTVNFESGILWRVGDP